MWRWVDGTLVFALVGLVTLFPGNARFWCALHATSLGDGSIASEDRTGVSLLRTAKAAEGVGSEVQFLFIAGHGQSRVPFLAVHGGLGVLGAVLHPDPQDIFVIGQGSGGTPLAAAVNPKTRHVKVVDIVAPVFDVMQEAAKRSGEDLQHRPIRNYYSDPRFARVVADARHVLLSEAIQYDIIEADAIHPTSALAGQLYSVEFFRLAMSRLKPGGYVVQWMPTDRTLSTFLQVFRCSRMSCARTPHW